MKFHIDGHYYTVENRRPKIGEFYIQDSSIEPIVRKLITEEEFEANGSTIGMLETYSKEGYYPYFISDTYGVDNDDYVIVKSSHITLHNGTV